MEILIALASILVITGLSWLFRRMVMTDSLLPRYHSVRSRRNSESLYRKLDKLLCPICMGVSLTWLWMLIASLLGFIPYAQFVTLVALMMGGSVVGIAYQYAEFRKPGVTKLTWLTWMIIPGFVTVYGLLVQEWLIAGVGALVWLGFALYAVISKGGPGSPAGDRGTDKDVDHKRKQLEKELEDCC